MMRTKKLRNFAVHRSAGKNTRGARICSSAKRYVQLGIQMELRLDNFVWVLGCTLCTVATALLFVPALVDFYFAYGRYVICLAIIVGLVATALVWYRSIKVKGWRNHLIASVKTAVFIAVFSAALMVLIVSHSGI
jgi:hypothetical protein